jgi:hypothetical protein
MKAIEYRGGEAVDEVLVWLDLWVSAHVWGDTDEHGRCLWLNFRLLEHESQDEVEVWYPQSQIVRPSQAPTREARAAGDEIANGFIKWDGCHEIQMDHHMCSAGQFRNASESFLRLLRWARDEHGFESLEEA